MTTRRTGTWLVIQISGEPLLLGCACDGERPRTRELVLNTAGDIASAYIDAPTWDEACLRFDELFWRHEDSGVYFA